MYLGDTYTNTMYVLPAISGLRRREETSTLEQSSIASPCIYARARAYIELIRDVCSFELSCGRTIDDRGPKLFGGLCTSTPDAELV